MSSSSVVENQEWLFTSRPGTGELGPANYTLRRTPLDLSSLESHEVVFRARYLTVDPYMRIQASTLPSWRVPHGDEAVQQGGAVGQVIAVGKAVTQVAKGDWVYAYSGWRLYARVLVTQLRKLPPPTERAPASTALGVLGMPGQTAFFGLNDAGRPRAGETLLVSGAAGAVGIMVAQLGKRAGCRVIGVAGSDEKVAMLTKAPYSLDAAFNYKTYGDVQAVKKKLEELAPEGVDLYWDNTGGHVTDAVFEHLANRARIIICGQVSQYNQLEKENLGPRFLHQIIYKRASIVGILARDYDHRVDEQERFLRPLVESGELLLPETVVKGFDQLPAALRDMLQGKNTGKMIVDTGDEQ